MCLFDDVVLYCVLCSVVCDLFVVVLVYDVLRCVFVRCCCDCCCVCMQFSYVCLLSVICSDTCFLIWRRAVLIVCALFILLLCYCVDALLVVVFCGCVCGYVFWCVL